MSNLQTTNKQRILAILVVIGLFFVVGSLLSLISANNKRENTKLVNEVIALKSEAAARSRIKKLEIVGLDKTKITAKSFLTMVMTEGGLKKELTAKNSQQVLPIASLTKLMTAIIVKEKVNLKTEILATSEYVGGYGSSKILEPGRTYLVLELLKNILISSDNDSAQLLSSVLGEKNFVELMNQKARDLGLDNTKYINTTGLDPLDKNIVPNYSTAEDTAKIVMYIYKRHPDIFQITRDAEYNFCDTDSDCRPIFSTNQLLTNLDFKFKIIGGKTGQTVLALRNLALIIEPFDGIFLVNIVLGSEDHFADTQAIINHLQQIN